MPSNLETVMVRLTKAEKARLDKFRQGPVGMVPAGQAVKYLMLKELERIEKRTKK